MRIYYYHIVDIRAVLDNWKAGCYPSHLLYGAPQLGNRGYEVVYHNGKPHLERWKQTLSTTIEVLRRYREYDIIYASAFRGLELIIFLRALRLFRKSLYVWHHQPIVKAKNPLREIAARLFYRGMDDLFFFSQRIIDESMHSAKANPKRMHIAHWGADMAYYEKLGGESIFSNPNTKANNNFISTGIEMRDMETLVAAFNATGKPIDIHVCEEYNGTNYRELFNALDCKANIHIHFVTGHAHGVLSQRVAESMCVVICCKETNYTVGLTTLVEALALGKPLIISRNPQIPIDIDKEQCGITVAYGDVEGWKKAISRIADNPDEALAMGQRAKKMAERLYNIERCADDIEKIL